MCNTTCDVHCANLSATLFVMCSLCKVKCNTICDVHYAKSIVTLLRISKYSASCKIKCDSVNNKGTCFLISLSLRKSLSNFNPSYTITVQTHMWVQIYGNPVHRWLPLGSASQREHQCVFPLWGGHISRQDADLDLSTLSFTFHHTQHWVNGYFCLWHTWVI